jgi:hypothetical protein
MEPTIAIYIGAPVSIGSEAKALRQLHDDLARAGVRAALLVNFEVGGRQIDCVAVTECQATMLDFKNLNGPVRGGVNGQWILRDYGGAERPYDGENPYQQALDAKFKLANALKEFHKAARVGFAPDRGQFVKLFDAAVCVTPDLDHGSSVQGDFKCWVWGYPQALSKITSRDLPQHWSIPEWQTFAAEHLRLEKVSLEAAVSPDHRVAERALIGYSEALRRELSAEIFPELPGPTISLPAGLHVHLTGRSGLGKTVHLKRHALAFAQSERLVLFCEGRRYKDSLDKLLARSVAVFSKATPGELVAAASKCGWGIDLIADGIDGFSASRQHDLADALSSFALRYGARIVVSSIGDVSLPPQIQNAFLHVPPLTHNQKHALFGFHSKTDCLPPVGFLDCFETAHDIMVAAKAATSLSPSASRADYYAGYLIECLPGDCRIVASALLKHLAWSMHRKMVRSIEFAEFECEAKTFLKAEGGQLEIADRVTALPQVSAFGGEFSFQHDLWQDYLAAECMLASNPDPKSLCERLSKPVNRRLAPHLIGRLRDPAVIGNAIESVCDTALVDDGFVGGMGQAAKMFLKRGCRKLWDDLIIDAGDLEITQAPEDESPDRVQVMLEWPTITGKRAWTHSEHVVATWLSERLHELENANEFARLLEITSHALWIASERAASRAKLSTRRVFGNALHVLVNIQGPSIPLTAFAMLRMWDHSRCVHQHEGDSNSALRVSLLTRLESCPENAKAGLLLGLATILRGDEHPVFSLLGRVFHLGWNLRVHPVRSQLLDMIVVQGRKLAECSPEIASSIRGELESALGDDVFVNTFIFDALNAMGAVNPPVTLEEALSEFRGVIDPESEYSQNVLAWHELCKSQFPNSPSTDTPLPTWADNLVGKFFEQIYQDVYWQAYETLTEPEKLQLMNIAAISEREWGICHSFVLRELVRFRDASSIGAFHFHAVRVRLNVPMQQDSVAAWCLGVIGCARLGMPLPEWRGGTDVASQAWRLIGELIYKDQLGEGSSPAASDLWLTLRSEALRGTADVLLHLQSCESCTGIAFEKEDVGCWSRFLRLYSGEVREIMELSLLQQDHLVSGSQWNKDRERGQFIVATLGSIGDRSSRAVLRRFVDHDDLGKEAVAAIGRICGREPRPKSS